MERRMKEMKVAFAAVQASRLTFALTHHATAGFGAGD